MNIVAMKSKVKAVAEVGGSTARYVLLAYAIARGVPYQKLERMTREDNKPRATLVLRELVPYLTEEEKQAGIDPLVLVSTFLPPVVQPEA